MGSHKPLVEARGMCRNVAPEMTVGKKALAIKNYQLLFLTQTSGQLSKTCYKHAYWGVVVALLSLKLLKGCGR